ncbi:MurR/RpiR family transcriptional regulator [Desulfonema ishimotonii]|uniref:MurR/RpiR family transcriptional regulator n=1 Tax=Desulfonema ishimotonii TaxID=45657 RepID=A0A401FS64_9BACT|nr:MurR/RpiR family transcriptional regulator [Desulfonema ishimotonii]GBC59809.1 MurR/RpiR family transcriptional regulator [Desulfonema ishimotonii]
MVTIQEHPLMKKIAENRSSLTPKGRILGDYILKNPRKVVFMTTKELAAACEVSEATVVRFVGQAGFDGYSDFLQTLRDLVDTELTLADRVDLTNLNKPGANRFQQEIFREIDNLKQLYKSVDMDSVNEVVDRLYQSPALYIVGSRASYPIAHYMGWLLGKIRQNIRTLKGSDTACIDCLTIAPADTLVVIIATSRYPNELIRLAKHVRRLGQKLVVFSDSALCPLNNFATLKLVAPSKHIPVFGNPTNITCLINYLLLELAGRYGDRLKAHQEKLEQAYRENDILFNLDTF